MTRISPTQLRFSWDIKDLDRTEDYLYERDFRCSRCGRQHDLNIDVNGEIWCGDCRQAERPYIVIR